MDSFLFIYLLTKFRKITGSFGYIYGKEDKWSI